MSRYDYQRGFYDCCAKLRDRELRAAVVRKIEYILSDLLTADPASATVLDVGCSAGIVTNSVSDHFARIFGMDIDLPALKMASREGQTEFLLGDAMLLPFGSAQFDLIMCLQVYEHVPDAVQLMGEISRVLKPGGLVVFSGPNKLFPIEPHYHLPLLHWLPQKWANRYLRLFNMGDHYYEKSRTPWGLRRLVSHFEITDISMDVLFFKLGERAPILASKAVQKHARKLLKVFLPLIPNYNWILQKPSG